MVTMVGKQAEFGSAVTELIELNYDTVEAYEAVITRLENTIYKRKLREFRNNHFQHIEELSNLLQKHGYAAPKGPSSERNWLTKGKVILANLMGDGAILSTMLSNEEDTNTAYEMMNERDDRWNDARDILRRGLEDERYHKKWFEQQA